MKKALITGVAGQDGYYLSELLLRNGYQVHGVTLPGIPLPADLRGRIAIHEMDLRTPEPLARLVREIAPDEVYYLAAHHFSSQGEENRNGLAAPFLAVNLVAVNIILETIKLNLPQTRFFYAASAHIFGTPDSFPQTELTPHRPVTPYAISKSAGVMLCRYYRETHGLHASVGILYNHESSRRAADFVTTRIAKAAALASLGKGTPVYFRNIHAVVDWGAAKDYVEAMWRLLQQPSGNECVISSGVARTVWEFAEVAFKCGGLKPDGVILQENSSTPIESVPYVGDSSKIRKLCGWFPAVSFEDLVREMVMNQLALLRNQSES
ncbi:MAG: hypothetical protein A2X28_02065 [Elusimicrobia bacterium GWA2_56_46]|nr:MAG: hypothetical protein A2X28_02065 [Elusimicrobia bacterium GWA2_56_46]OGR55445.1 MAG: hypothetical protein A2X39_00900 [Elusimicrobia bacterium GWC2_56_31]HBW21911.1 GDP-mannose 4,6-dehydratase [Elusimicrobiota bacterium]